jgi:ribosomal protein S27AE
MAITLYLSFKVVPLRTHLHHCSKCGKVRVCKLRRERWTCARCQSGPAVAKRIAA